jgi:hypothetical protein
MCGSRNGGAVMETRLRADEQTNVSSIFWQKAPQTDTEAHTAPYSKRYMVSLPASIAAVTRI